MNRKKKKEEDEKQKEITYLRTKDRTYYFALRDCYYMSIKAENAARLMYLATFIRQDTGGKLVNYHDSKPITRRNLSAILGFGETATKRFWGEVKDKFITVKPDGLYMDPDIFFKGRLKEKPVNKQYYQFYCDAIRAIYKATPTRQHCHLGYVFRLLPYLNLEYNVLCHNPDEKDLEKIDYLTFDEFCTLNGYTVEHRTKLIEIYKHLKFHTPYGEQVLLSAIIPFGNLNDAKLYINPYVIYKGGKYAIAYALGEFAQPIKSREPRQRKFYPRNANLLP